MAEISEAVRKAGMKFGFWLEAETASPSAETIRLHPEYYLVQDGRYFFNYARADAREHMTKIACGLIDLYHASFIKFDFNQDIEYDPSGSDFADFHAGFRSFVNGLKARYPELYVEGCASGGLRMDLGDSMLFDSFWLSDNQSPYFGNRIVRETMLRLPPQVIERWIVARSDESPQEDYKGDHTQLFSANDSLWVDVRSVQTSYLESFLTGGIAGFSCDLTAFSEKDLAFLKEYLTRYKADKAFWNRAVGRILCDTETMTVLEYSDPAFEEVRLVAYGERIRQETTEIIPVLDPNARYRVGEEIRTGSELMDEGIEVNGPESLRALFLTLRKER